MKPTIEILTKLQENSSKHHDEIFTRLFRYMLRPDIYYVAYQHLYSRAIGEKLFANSGKKRYNEFEVKKDVKH